MQQQTWRILLIDDDEEDYFLIQEQLLRTQNVRCRVEWANSMQAGQEAIETNVYDAVLVDYQMGASTGIEIIREAVFNNYPAPVLLLTGQGSYEVDLEAMQAGAADYLNKSGLSTGLLERSIRYAIERKRIERELDYHLRERSDILESIQDGLFGLDQNWCITYINPTAAQNQGFAPEELTGRNFWETFPELKGTPLEAHYRYAMTEQEPVQFEMKGVHQDRWYAISVYPSIEGIAVYSQDITVRKQAEEQLAYHARLVDNLHDAVVATDVEQHVIAWNKAAEKMYGYTAGEVLGKLVGQVIRMDMSEAERGRILEKLAESGQHTVEAVHHTKDGQSLIVESSIILWRDSQGKVVGYISANRDITERKRAEEALREHLLQKEIHHRLLEYGEKERQAIARDLHDGPVQDLVSLIFQAEFARGSVADPQAREEMEQFSRRLKETVKSLREVISEMRPPSLIRFGLSKALQVFIDEFRERNPGIEVRAALMDDGDRLSEQVRLNLFRIAQEALNNTLKHARAASVSVQFRATDHQCILEVQDNGCGFTPTDDVLEYGQNGHYGLVGMKERAEAIEGNLIVSSEPGKGTSILVSVPVRG